MPKTSRANAAAQDTCFLLASHGHLLKNAFSSVPVLASHSIVEEIRFSRLAPISFGYLSIRELEGPPYIPQYLFFFFESRFISRLNTSSFSPPSLSPPYHHDIHSNHSRSHPRIPCWPIITASTCSFSRPTPSHRTLLR